MAPHSSDSTWPKVIQRSDATGSTRSTASQTESNMDRCPVWKRSGSSSSIRNWLKVNPSGPMSGTCVDNR